MSVLVSRRNWWSSGLWLAKPLAFHWVMRRVLTASLLRVSDNCREHV